MSLEVEKASPEEAMDLLSYAPKTKLGEKLLAIRERIVATGVSLLDLSEIEKEIATRRGEYHDKTI